MSFVAVARLAFTAGMIPHIAQLVQLLRDERRQAELLLCGRLFAAGGLKKKTAQAVGTTTPLASGSVEDTCFEVQGKC